MSSASAEQLVIAFNFPPYNDGSAVTVAKRIVEAGVGVDVISAELSRVRSTDDSLFELVAPYVRSLRQVSIPIKFADPSSVRLFTQRGLEAARQRGDQSYPSVYSRSMWPHSHFLAAHARVSGLGRKWIAEFSDPILWHADATRRPSGLMSLDDFDASLLWHLGAREQDFLCAHRSVLEWAQFVPFLLADELVFTNEQQMGVMLSDAPDWLRYSVLERSTVSPHPTLPERYYGAPQGDTSGREDGVFSIGYFGTFYPNRGGGELLEAISSLPLAGRSKIRFEVHSDNSPALMRAASILGVSEQVLVRPTVPFTEFLQKTREYDALLVNDIATSPFGTPSPFLPSKYSDYAGSSSSIMAISLAGSPLDNLPARFKARTGDVDSIRTMLMEAIASLPSSRSAANSAPC